MMAAVRAAGSGGKVILLEKNEKLGKKLYITGKGRCNLTNDCPPDEFLDCVVSNPKFLIGAINTFPPEAAMRFFEDNGLRLKTERGNRVFPLSDKASDVTKTLSLALEKAGVDICFCEKSEKIITDNGKVCGVLTDKRIIACQSAIICTGGISYPATGSTGDGYALAKSLGHSVIEPIPALSALEISGGLCKRLQGLSLINVRLSAFNGAKKIYSDIGEMLFTHFGVSGPLVLTVSSLINRIPTSEVWLSIDLKPGLDEQSLKRRIERDFLLFKGKNLNNSLVKLLPSRMISEVILAAQLDGEKKNASISGAELNTLVGSIKNFKLKVNALRPITEAIVTAGGINVKEINPKTMESKLIKGLFFAGEVIDVDAFTGGFNIQTALSTGYIAGESV